MCDHQRGRCSGFAPTEPGKARRRKCVVYTSKQQHGCYCQRLLSHSLQPRPQSLQGHSTATSCTPLHCGHGHPCHQTPPPGNPKRRSPPAHFMWEGAQLTTTHGPLDTCTATATATTTYRWLSCEPGHAIHEASQLDDALHFVQISEFGCHVVIGTRGECDATHIPPAPTPHLSTTTAD